MVDLAEIQAAYYMVAATGVLVAAIYYVLNMRATQKNTKQTLDTRQVQLFMNVFQKFEEPDFQNTYWELMSFQWRDFNDYQAKYGGAVNPEAFRKLSRIGTFFEGIGVLVKRGFIDAAIVDDMMSMFIIGWWEKYEPVYIGMRKLWNTPTVAEHFEYLYGVVSEIYGGEHPGHGKLSLSQ